MQRFKEFRGRLGVAKHETEISAAMQELLNAILPSETAEFPDDVLSALTADFRDIPSSAVTLKRSELLFDGSGESRSFLHQLALVYEEASQRIAQMHARRAQP